VTWLAVEGLDASGLDRCSSSEAVPNLLDSRPFDARSCPFVPVLAKPTVEDFEDAIVRAMLEGRGHVAEGLARALRSRRAAAAGNVLRMPVLPKRR
jgi:hypothetical protein